MVTGYNFNNDNMKFVKRIRQTKLSIQLLMITTSIQLISAVLAIFLVGGNEAAGITIWVLEILCLFINIPALFMLVFGLDELRDKIDNTKKSPLRFAIVFIGIYIGYYILATIISLIIVTNNFDLSTLIAKDLMCFVFISIALVFISLAFDKMSKQGYPTKLLLTPLITLPIIALVGFVIGWIEMFLNSIEYGGGTFVILIVVTSIYLVIALGGSLLELFLSVKKLHNEILTNLAPELLLKKEKKKKANKKKGKADRAVV